MTRVVLAPATDEHQRRRPEDDNHRKMQRSAPQYYDKNVRRVHKHRPVPKKFVWSATTINEPLKTQRCRYPGVYQALRPYFLMLKVFGMFPIRNATSHTGQNISFSYLSFHALHSVILIIILVIILLTDFWYFGLYFDVGNLRLMFRYLSFPMFLTSATLTAILFFKFSVRLPDLLREWEQAAQKLEKYLISTDPGYNDSEDDDHKISFYLTPGMTIAVVTALLAIAAAHNSYRIASSCLPDDYPDIDHYLMSHMQYCAPYVELVLGSNIPSAIVACFVVLFTSIVWNMRDIVVILLSLAFYYQFKIIPHYLKRVGSQSLTRKQWQQLRIDHQAICKIVGKMDDALACMILQSYIFNLYHISLDLFTTFTLTSKSLQKSLFRVVTISFFSFRVAAVTLSAAKFNQMAKEPLRYLYRCPSSSYCEEIINLVVTYELILLGV